MGHGLLRPTAVALAVILAMAALGACGGQASPTSDSDQGQSLSASRTKEYRTLAELAKESSIVAVVRATDDAAVEILHDIPFTVTTVKVTRSLQGTSAGAALKVRQTGSAKTEIQHDFPPILEAGQSYLLFLYPFTFTKGRVNGSVLRHRRRGDLRCRRCRLPATGPGLEGASRCGHRVRRDHGAGRLIRSGIGGHALVGCPCTSPDENKVPLHP